MRFLRFKPISIYTALGQAGGVDTKTGDTTNIQLIRNGRTFNLNTIQLEKRGLSLHNLLIQPNNTIFVNTKQEQKLYVMGESSKSQALALRDQGMTLSDVLVKAKASIHILQVQHVSILCVLIYKIKPQLFTI